MRFISDKRLILNCEDIKSRGILNVIIHFNEKNILFFTGYTVSVLDDELLSCSDFRKGVK